MMKVKNIEVQKVIVSHCIKKKIFYVPFDSQLKASHTPLHREYANVICPLTVLNWETKIIKLLIIKAAKEQQNQTQSNLPA